MRHGVVRVGPDGLRVVVPDTNQYRVARRWKLTHVEKHKNKTKNNQKINGVRLSLSGWRRRGVPWGEVSHGEARPLHSIKPKKECLVVETRGFEFCNRCGRASERERETTKARETTCDVVKCTWVSLPSFGSFATPSLTFPNPKTLCCESLRLPSRPHSPGNDYYLL